MNTQTDKPIVFCGLEGNALPPTTITNWINDPITNIVHYHECCYEYNKLKKLEKEREIKIYMYKSKIYNWKCPHTQKYYDDKYNHLNDKRSDSLIPPPLVLRFVYPQCCMYDHALTYSRRHESNIPINIEDALRD